jgi:hypothetical protein
LGERRGYPVYPGDARPCKAGHDTYLYAGEHRRSREKRSVQSVQSDRTSWWKPGNAKGVVYVTDIGIYAGDIYEFNGNQYLATWNLKENSVEISKWDYTWGTSDTDDEEDLAIPNETYNIYRQKTGKGGDFLALSPIRLKHFPFILQVK